jgi:hypothetical protein
MSQIMTRGRFSFLLLIGLVMLAGCGTPNDKAPFPADTGKHAAGWLPAQHSAAAEADIASCKECHGDDLAGGISGKGCTGCHMGGPTSKHPTDWANSIQTKHGTYVAANSSDACRNIYCHGSSLEGVANSGPQCNGTCHSYP